MPANKTYEIKYYSPSIVRSGRYDFCLRYHEEGRYLDFEGQEEGENSPGSINFPSQEEWDSIYPKWNGMRDTVRIRIIEWAQQWRHHHHLIKNLEK